MKIRHAISTDAPIIHAAEQVIAQSPGLLASLPSELKLPAYAAKITELAQNPRGTYIVAEKDNHIVGHAMLEPMGLERISHIVRLTIAVHPGHQEKGVGLAMLTHLIEWAKQTSGVEKIELNVRATNARAIHLYTKCGFVKEGLLKNRSKISDGHYIDEVLMGLLVK